MNKWDFDEAVFAGFLLGVWTTVLVALILWWMLV